MNTYNIGIDDSSTTIGRRTIIYAYVVSVNNNWVAQKESSHKV